MPTLLIVSITQGAGKTTLAATLAAHLGEGDRKTGLAKAYTASPAVEEDLDFQVFRSLLPATASPPPSPLGSPPSRVSEAIAKLDSALNIVEGLSGETEVNSQLAIALDARVIVVAGLKDDIVPFASSFGDRLVGVVINNLPRFRRHLLETEVLPKLAEADIPYLGAIPEDRRMLALTVRAMSEHLGGHFSRWEESAEALADHILIGGNVLDWGVHYFSSRENAVGLIRGDRPDIQMAALATPIKGLILTEGVEPLEYVFYEAREEEIPIAVVPQGTHEAAQALETLQEKARFDHPAKLQRFLELLRAQVNLEAIEGTLRQPVTR